MMVGGERRNFDASRLPPIRKSRNLIQMMLPMSLCCNTCRNQMNKGTKFTSRIEKLVETPSTTTHHHHHVVEDNERIVPAAFRFYFRCPRCCAHLSMRTDPLTFDYILESGATRIPKRPNFDFDFEFDFREEEDNHYQHESKKRKLEQEKEELGTQSEGGGYDLLDLSFEERRLGLQPSSLPYLCCFEYYLDAIFLATYQFTKDNCMYWNSP